MLLEKLMNIRILSIVIIAAILVNCSIASTSVVQGKISESSPVDFVTVQPASIKWKSYPNEPGVQSAVLFGNPLEVGPLIMRYRLPANFQVQPHTHPNTRTYTILSGAWKLGLGEKFEIEKLQTFTQGGLYRLPANLPHFQEAGSMGATIQIESIGPDGFKFLDSQ